MNAKSLLEEIIENWNYILIEDKDSHKYKLELVENTGRHKETTNIVLGIKLEWMNQYIFKSTWTFQEAVGLIGGYEVQLASALEICYYNLLEGVIKSGLNANINDWLSGRLERVGDQIKMNPTTDQLLKKLGIKIIAA